jgi:hypothetical protein
MLLNRIMFVDGCKGKKVIKRNGYELELAMEISLTSLGSSQTFPLPHFSTLADSLFCNFSETIFANSNQSEKRTLIFFFRCIYIIILKGLIGKFHLNSHKFCKLSIYSVYSKSLMNMFFPR